MASVLKVDKIQLPDGSAPTASDLGLDVAVGDMPAGTVLQMQTGNFLGSSIETASASFTNSGATVTITPKFANSKMFIMAKANLRTHSVYGPQLRITRDGTNITNYGNSGPYLQYRDFSGNSHDIVSISEVDVPNTTSPVTYYLQFASYGSNTIGLWGWNGAQVHVIEIAQ